MATFGFEGEKLNSIGTAGVVPAGQYAKGIIVVTVTSGNRVTITGSYEVWADEGESIAGFGMVLYFNKP